ncbi:acyl-CoA dehydrogenase family protein [Modicisalibacter coralii]|uniref:acyl-CoA dehydrogenase family protein n=1 Tax=Modicisalibacter coralii TaxID=2304602 RepID=UPI00100ACF1C|nr:acyl-CoA dehydrogenase family protein [Halomonas coralii]
MPYQDKQVTQQARASIDAIARALDVEYPTDSEFPREKWQAVSSSGIFRRAANAESKREAILSTMASLERLGEVCKDSGLAFSVATHLASTITALDKFGSPELKGRYMDELVAGQLIGAHAISEPNAGSDALSMTTVAHEDGDDFVINGHKAFVTNGSVADVIVVYAKTSQAATADCVSAFLVDTRLPGVHLGPTMEKVGLSTSPLCELALDNCRVSKENMVGRRGAGFFVLSHVMQREILYSFIISVGEMKRRLGRCVRYANSRRQFGTSIGSFQSVANKVADMKIRYELSRQWLYHVADRMIANKDVTTEVAIAKVFVSENALATSVDALHIHGGYGYIASNGLGTEVCNALAGPIYSGTNEIQRGRIAAMLGISQGKAKPAEDIASREVVRSETRVVRQVDVERTHSELLDFLHDDVQTFVSVALGDEPLDERETAVKLFYAVRDKIAYEVFDTDISNAGLRASQIVNDRRGFCLHKALLYATACRSQGLACRVVASRVINHIATPELQDLVGGDVFLHWYNEVKVGDAWLQVSPVFNKLLCKLYGIEPLEFDGYSSAIHQPFSGGLAMNYLDDPMVFTNPGYAELIELVNTYHPGMVTPGGRVPQAKTSGAVL